MTDMVKYSYNGLSATVAVLSKVTLVTGYLELVRQDVNIRKGTSIYRLGMTMSVIFLTRQSAADTPRGELAPPIL